jgi:hypothetical protein
MVSSKYSTKTIFDLMKINTCTVESISCTVKKCFNSFLTQDELLFKICVPCITGTLTELLYSFVQSTAPLTQYGVTNDFFYILNCQQSLSFYAPFFYCIASTVLTYSTCTSCICSYDNDSKKCTLYCSQYCW